MKKKLIYFIAYSLVLTAGCKRETSLDELPMVFPEPVDNKIEVVLNMVVTDDDVFEVFYTEDGSNNFGEHHVRTTIVGNTNAQDIVFPLENDAHPTNFRLDFGENKEQGKMIINQMSIKYHKKVLQISASEFFLYFISYNISFLPQQQAVITLKDEDEPYDPISYATPLLQKKLKEIVK